MRYCIIDIEDANRISFETIRETSVETLRISKDRLKTFVKFDGEIPPDIASMDYQGPFSHAEMLEILSGSNWSA